MNLKNVVELVNQVSSMDIDFEEITIDGNVITIEGSDYIVYDKEEINKQMDAHIHETASYFNSNFLSSMTGLPKDVFEALVDKNEAVYQLISKTCGLEEFIEECLNTDGAGHFLNSYNGEKYELGDGLSAFNY